MNQEVTQTTIKEINQLSLISLHFDKEEVKILYYNLNCNYLKVNELLANIPNELIKSKIEKLEQKKISKTEFVKELNKLLEEKFAEDERLKKKVKIDINWKDWSLPKSTSPILKRLHLNDLVIVCQFLDVYSLYALCTTEKFYYKLERAQPQIYKPICGLVFKQLPQAQDDLYSHFHSQIRQSSLPMSNPQLYEQIKTNIRNVVWKKDPKSIKTAKKYFGNSLDMRTLFFKFPRIRFDGYYACCETYLRKGTADLTGFYTPVHYIKSYRYLRFYDTGNVLYMISTKKFDEEQALKYLNLQSFYRKMMNDQNRDSVMFGEFIIHNDRLQIKMPDKTWINEMEHIMCMGDDNLTYLHIQEHTMRDMETGCVHQMERDMKEKERYYYFHRMKEFTKDVKCKELQAPFNFSN